tara:strand:+ start:42747 stop:43136 length:390 start_codon:yes stop_codon:yes gene_type:complete
LYPNGIPPQPEDGHGHDHQKGQNLKGAYQKIIGTPQWGEKSVGPQKTVQNNFQYLYVDDDKTQIYDYMEQPSHGPYDHLGLAKGNFGHVFPTQGLMVVYGNILSQANVTYKALTIFHKKTDAGYQYDRK